MIRKKMILNETLNTHFLSKETHKIKKKKQRDSEKFIESCADFAIKLLTRI